MSDNKPVDVILLGQGVHGLVAANLLAREGVSVMVCDAVLPEGVDDEVTQGAYVGECAHFPITLSAATAQALELPAQTMHTPLILDRVRHLAGLLYALSGRIPAYDEKGWRDLWAVFETGNALAGQSAEDQDLFADLMKLSAVDFAKKYGADSSEQGVLCALAVMGYDHAPTRQGSAAGLIGVALCPDQAVQISGSLSSIARNLREKAEDYGVRFESQRLVRALDIDTMRVQGVVFDDDSKAHAKTVLSDLNPLHLFETLAKDAALPDLFTRRLQAMQRRMRAVRVTMTVEGKPDFKNLAAETHDIQASQGFVYAPDADYCTAADKQARQDGGAADPILSVIVPTLADPSLAPDGQHTISVLAQYFDASLPADADNQQSVLDACTQALEVISPHIVDSVVGARIFMGPMLDRTIGPFNRSEQLSAQPIIQVLASLSGHHALGYDQPLQGLMLVGYGAEAGGAPHLSGSGTRAAQAVLRLMNKAA